MRLIIAVSFLFAVLSLAAAQSDKPKPDFDLVCAMTAGAQMSLKQDEPKEAAAVSFFSFYLGRLSARDDSTDWTVVVQGRLAERKWAAPVPQLLSTCLDFYQSKLKN
jgi:hypothetical protein